MTDDDKAFRGATEDERLAIGKAAVRAAYEALEGYAPEDQTEPVEKSIGQILNAFRAASAAVDAYVRLIEERDAVDLLVDPHLAAYVATAIFVHLDHVGAGDVDLAEAHPLCVGGAPYLDFAAAVMLMRDVDRARTVAECPMDELSPTSDAIDGALAVLKAQHPEAAVVAAIAEDDQ